MLLIAGVPNPYLFTFVYPYVQKLHYKVVFPFAVPTSNWNPAVSVFTEIKAIADMNVESDGKLDKLEFFLGKLNSKGLSRPTTN